MSPALLPMRGPNNSRLAVHFPAGNIDIGTIAVDPGRRMTLRVCGRYLLWTGRAFDDPFPSWIRNGVTLLLVSFRLSKWHKNVEIFCRKSLKRVVF